MSNVQPDAAMASETHEHARKYDVNVEGVDHIWHKPTITVPEIRALGGFAPTDQIIEIHLEDNTELTLPEGAVVHLQPGKEFGKKVRFKRG